MATFYKSYNKDRNTRINRTNKFMMSKHINRVIYQIYNYIYNVIYHALQNDV